MHSDAFGRVRKFSEIFGNFRTFFGVGGIGRIFLKNLKCHFLKSLTETDAVHPDFDETDRLPGTFFKILSKVAFFIFAGNFGRAAFDRYDR